MVIAFAAGPVWAEQPSGSEVSTNSTNDELNALISILEDDSARNALIERLRKVTADPAETQPAPTAVEQPTFSRRIAQMTQSFAVSTMKKAAKAGRQIASLPATIKRFDKRALVALWGTLKHLAVLIFVTAGVYFVLRRYAKGMYVHLNERTVGAGIGKRFGLWLLAGGIDAATVIATWAVGYGVALLAVGDTGQIGIRQTMFLNAFLLVSMFKVAIRLFIAPNARELRPLPVSTSAARYLSRRITWISGIVGYGQLLLVPIVNGNVSYSSGQLVSTVISISVLLYLIRISIKNRVAVANWIAGGASEDETAQDDTTIEATETHKPGLAQRLSAYWYVLVVAYLLVMTFIILAQPPRLVMKSFISSGQMLLVVMLGITLSSFLNRMTADGVPIPNTLSHRFPLLQSRLNSFLPLFLTVIRYAIAMLAGLLLMDAVSAIDLPKLISSPLGLQLVSTGLAVLIILFVSFLIWLALVSWIDYRLNPSVGKVASSRELTLLTLFRNAATIALLVITLMFVLSEIGLDIAPLLASAGVLGLAIGFGAQKMVQDIITGIFIQIENAMNVGDIVTVGNITGKVEKLTIRSVSIRDKEGAFHILPFSSVDMVTSYARDFGYYLCDMGVGYSEDADAVKTAMLDAFNELVSVKEHKKKIKGDLEWHGLQSFGDSAVVFRARIKCTPGDQWAIGRAYNQIMKRIFDERGIEIPFPHQTLYFGDAQEKESGPEKLTNANKA